MTLKKKVYSCDKCGTETESVWALGFYGSKKATCQICEACKDEIYGSLSAKPEWKLNPKSDNY